MSEALWIALVGVVGTLLSGLGATYLANKAAEKQRAETRKHELEDSSRLAILEVLVSARRWIESADGPAVVIASQDSVEQIDAYVAQQAVEPTDMKPMSEHREALERSVMHAKLLISDGDVRDELEALVVLASWWEAEVINQPRSDLMLGIGDKGGRLQHWRQFQNSFRASADRLEKIAITAIARPIAA